MPPELDGWNFMVKIPMENLDDNSGYLYFWETPIWKTLEIHGHEKDRRGTPSPRNTRLAIFLKNHSMYLPNHRNVYEKPLTCQCQINGLPSTWLGGFKGYSGHQADLASEASTSTSTSLQHGNHSPGVAPVAIPLSKSSFRKGGMDRWWIHPGKLHAAFLIYIFSASSPLTALLHTLHLSLSGCGFSHIFSFSPSLTTYYSILLVLNLFVAKSQLKTNSCRFFSVLYPLLLFA